MNARTPLFPRIGQLGGGFLGGPARLPPIVVTRPARLAGTTLVYATPARTVPIGAVNPPTFELTAGPWPAGWVEIVFERTRAGTLPQRILGFVEESAFITPPARPAAPQLCTSPSCLLFAIPIASRPITAADEASALRVPKGTPVEVTRTTTPPGWAEVLVDFPPGSGTIARRYVRLTDLALPEAGEVAPLPNGGSGTPTRDEPVPTPPTAADPSPLRQVSEVALLTAPAWGAVLYTMLFPAR